MAKWTIINGGSGDADQIGKDGVFYDNLDLTFLPDDVCAVQSADGVTADVEKGNPATGHRTSTEEDVATSTLSWWPSVSTTWQAAWDAEHATELTALTISSGTLSPAFDTDTISYTASVANSVTSITVTATARDSGSTILIIGDDSLDVGDNDIEITITKDNSPSRMYVVTVTRAAS